MKCYSKHYFLFFFFRDIVSELFQLLLRKNDELVESEVHNEQEEA